MPVTEPKPTPYRTVFVVVVLALFGGVVCVWVKGSFGDYASVLKYLGWAVAVKSGFEHHTKTRAVKNGP